jgi:hypothetical protein
MKATYSSETSVISQKIELFITSAEILKSYTGYLEINSRPEGFGSGSDMILWRIFLQYLRTKCWDGHLK